MQRKSKRKETQIQEKLKKEDKEAKRLCIACATPVEYVPVYTKDPRKTVGDIPFCVNPGCPRYGILCVVTGVEKDEPKSDGESSRS